MPEQVVVERATRQREAVELLVRGRDEFGMTVAEVQRRVAREAVEVATTVDVGDPRTVTFGAERPAAGDRCARRVPRLARCRAGRQRSDGDVAGHDRSSSVQHFGPPPAFLSSPSSTGTGW